MDPATRVTMQQFRAQWRVGFDRKSLLTLEQEREWWETVITSNPPVHDDDIRILEEFDDRVDLLRTRLIQAGERENPLAFFIPTYEQAQFLNAWSPEFDPTAAPEGYNSVANFGGKRSGKTVGVVANALLWMVPNDPEWLMFQPQKDQHGRTYQILRRPMFDFWQRKNRLSYTADEAPVQGRIIWHGCVDEQHWKRKIEKHYRNLMPMRYVARHQDQKSYIWNLSERYFKTQWGVELVGMLYKSDIQAWGGEELFMTMFDEGPPRAVVDEIVARSLYIAWSYTPAEPANTKDRVMVARDVHDGKLQLIGQTYMIKSDMRKMPERITPKKVLDARIKTLSTRGVEGELAMAGGFFDNSPRVIDLFQRERHVLPITGEQVSRAIKGQWTPEEIKRFPWLQKFQDANIIRGFDEGFVHATACVWNALLRSGEQVFFRLFSRSATTIKERVERIVEASGNRLCEVTPTLSLQETAQIQIAQLYSRDLAADAEREKATGDKVRRYHEEQTNELVRKTFGDSKMFKRDPNYLMDDWGSNYNRAGLKLERASTRGPKERCSVLNGLFRANPSRQHLNPAQATDDFPHGYDGYVVCDCDDGQASLVERFERYLWETIIGGARKGEFTGEPEKDGDDEIDAAAYACNHKLRWVPNEELRERRMAA